MLKIKNIIFTRCSQSMKHVIKCDISLEAKSQSGICSANNYASLTAKDPESLGTKDLALHPNAFFRAVYPEARLSKHALRVESVEKIENE